MIDPADPTPIDPKSGLRGILFQIACAVVVGVAYYKLGYSVGHYNGVVQFCVPTEPSYEHRTIVQPRHGQEALVCDVNPMEKPCL